MWSYKRSRLFDEPPSATVHCPPLATHLFSPAAAAAAFD